MPCNLAEGSTGIQVIEGATEVDVETGSPET